MLPERPSRRNTKHRIDVCESIIDGDPAERVRPRKPATATIQKKAARENLARL
jgi:hypothetical protein